MGSSFLFRSFQITDRRDLYIALTLPALGYVAIKVLAKLTAAATYTGVLPKPRPLNAPAQRLLSRYEHDDNPYPADALPGGRNIATPYGNIRAYEWGPVEGRKVLFIHGISTPSIALARIATRLADEGCRVMLFDLFGRGYSDAPDSKVYRQDINLFTYQILAVLASSRLNWTKGFTMCGYSLGGGIGAAFTSYYPSLVESLVLIAPGGVLRRTRISLSSKVLYSGLLPDSFVHYLVRRMLRTGNKTSSVVNRRTSITTSGKFSATDAAAEELPEARGAHAKDSASSIFDDRPHISSATAVAWQLENHQGFIPSFVSCVKYGPIHDGFARWRLIGERCAAQRRAKRAGHVTRGLQEGRVLILLGLQDVVINSKETDADAREAFGEENVKIVGMQGGHDLPIADSQGCIDHMMSFWKESS